MVGTHREKYSQICTIDLNHPYSPISTAAADGEGTKSDLYRCLCPHPKETDARTTQSYCPSGYTCGIPRLGDHHHHHYGENTPTSSWAMMMTPVDCIQSGNETMKSIVRMAWPVSLTLFAFLLFWLCGTMNGKALYQFLYKTYLRRTWKNNNNNNNDVSNDQRETDVEEASPPPSLSPLEELERAEVQSLLDWAAGTTTTTAATVVASSSTSDSASWWTSTTFRPPQAPPDQWWSIPQQKEYLYKLTIMECVRKKWRQEWKEVDPSPAAPLCLPVKRYDCPHEHNNDNDDDNEQEQGQRRQEDPPAVKMMTMTGTVDHAQLHSQNDTTTEKDDNDDDDDSSAAGPTCSICLVDVVHGDKVGDLKCGHVFHSDCLKAWLTTGRNNNCPLCHAPRIAVLRPHAKTPAATDTLAAKPTRRMGRWNRESNPTPSLSSSTRIVAPTRTTRPATTTTTMTVSTTTDESSSVQNSDAEQDHSRHHIRESDAETTFRIPDEGTVNQ